MRYFAAGVSALALAALLHTTDARAFTVQTFSNTNQDGSQRFSDPDEQAPVQKLTDPSTGRTGYSVGGSNFHFSITGGSGGSSDTPPGSFDSMSSYRSPFQAPKVPFGQPYGSFRH